MGVHQKRIGDDHVTIYTRQMNGRWQWSYVLDGYVAELTESPLPSEALAVIEATRDAECFLKQRHCKNTYVE